MDLLDTNIVIAIINGRDTAIQARFRARLAEPVSLAVSSVVLFELRYGYAKSDRARQMAALLDTFLSAGIEVLDFDAQDAEQAGLVRAELEAAGTPIGAYDTLIAGQARNRGGSLITRNIREFSRVRGLLIDDWGSNSG